MRDRCVDAKRIKELCTIIASPPKELAVWGDLCMMMFDPFVASVFTTSAFASIKEAITLSQLPREHEQLRAVLSLVAYGHTAHKMIESRQFRAPEVPATLLTQFIPAMMAQMVDDADAAKKAAGDTAAQRARAPIPTQVQLLIQVRPSICIWCVGVYGGC